MSLRQCTPFSAVWGAPRVSAARPGRCRHCLRVYAVGWDPENILSAPRAGHLRRREVQKQVAIDQDLQRQADNAREDARKELLRQREDRVAPTSHAEVIEYLLSTTSEEMEYETVRCRPLITEDFFTFLGQQIGQERFAKIPNEDRVAELQGLRDYLAEAISRVDAQAKAMAAPKDRLMRLLSAPDKRAVLLQMAGDGEIDEGLLKLLQTNIDAAKAAGQEQPVQFMEKIRDAARRFMLNEV